MGKNKRRNAWRDSAVKALEIEMGEYPYKRSHLVALRRTKI